MKRFITTLVLALATTATTAVISTTPAHAQAPSAADMAKAKKAFDEGKAAQQEAPQPSNCTTDWRARIELQHIRPYARRIGLSDVTSTA